MKHSFISQSGSRRLILLFAGWGMDDSPFRGLHRPGYDIAVVWDYRDMTAPAKLTEGYSEVCVIAWSYGVYAAAKLLPQLGEKVTRRIAVNGTLTPVNDLTGIPEALFKATLDNIDEANMTRFYRRMCGGAAAYRLFAAQTPQRDIDSLRQELEVFSPERTVSNLNAGFDLAIISDKDAIVPPAAQLEAWKDIPHLIVEGPHLPDFQSILNRYTINKDLVGERFARGRDSYDSEALAQRHTIDRLCTALAVNGLDKQLRSLSSVLEVGSGTGLLSRRLDALCGDDCTLEMWDLAGEAPVSGKNRVFRRTDAETAVRDLPDESLDAIFSASTVQWFNSPERFFHECARVLKRGGLLAITTFEDGNLAEIEQATGKTLPLFSAAQWTAMVPPSLRMLFSESIRYTMTFDSAIDVFRHLRRTGVDSLGDKNAAPALQRAIKAYPVNNEGKYSLTYRPFIMLMQKKS